MMASRARVGPKLWVIGLLATAALVLGGILLSRSDGVENTATKVDRRPTPVELRRIVDSLARVFSLPATAVRQRREYVRKKLQLMPEHRIEVSRDFSTLAFNLALSHSVARFGSVVSGEERPREKKTILRVLHDDKEVWTLVFLIGNTSGGKESDNRR